MAVRRSLAKELNTPPQRRQSSRLASKKGTPFRSAVGHRVASSSTVANLATPRTLLRKVLQTQPVVSPLIPEKPDSPKQLESMPSLLKPVEPEPELPSGIAPHSSLELSSSNPVPKYTSRATYLNARTKKKARVSEFERVLDKQFTSNTASSPLGNTSLTRSLQISFATPEPVEDAGKKGLILRPKNFRGVDVKAFEQNLLQIKDSQQQNLEAATQISINKEVDLTATELFAQPQLSGQGRSQDSVFYSQPSSTRKSPRRQQNTFPSVQTPLQDTNFDMDAEGVTQTGQKESLTAEDECADGTEAIPEERTASSGEEGLEGTEDGLQGSNLKEATSGFEDADRLDTESQATAVTPESQDKKKDSKDENDDMEEFLSYGEDLDDDIGTARTSTPADIKLPAVHPGNLSYLLHKKPHKRSVKEMVTQILKELDDSLASTSVYHGGSGANLEEEHPPHKEGINRIPTWDNSHSTSTALQITQKTEVGSRKNPKLLSTLSTNNMVDEQAHCSGKMREAEDEVVSNAETDSEPEELMEVESESEIDAEPTEKTPTFVRTRAFRCSQLLDTPQPQASASKSSSKQPLPKQIPKQTKRARKEKRTGSLPSSLVKNIFSHYVRMPVSKDAFKAVEKCVDLFFKNLFDDLEVYTRHAGRKITNASDFELLMRRQGLITDNMPLNVLIERHMPMEYRKLLIPMATSGNKVFPSKQL